MSNIICDLKDLGRVILEYELNKDPQKLHREPNKTDITKVCRKGFDIIHHFDVKKVKHPCEIENGMIWNAEILITDSCFELDRLGNHTASEVLWKSVEELKKINSKHLNSVFILLLLLKQPGQNKFKQKHPFSPSGSDFFFKRINPFDIIPPHLTSFSLNIDKLEPENKPELFIDRFVDRSNISANSEVNRPKFSLQKLVNCESVEIGDKGSCTPKTSDHFINDGPKDNPLPDRPLSPWSYMLECTDKEDLIDENNFDRKKSLKEIYEASLNSNDMTGAIKRKKRRPVSGRERRALDFCHEDKRYLQMLSPDITNLFYPISKESYVKHVKFLLCGINTDIFKYDDSSKKYFMKVGICLDDFTPDSLFEFSEEFLEIGSCFHVLREAAKNGLNCDSSATFHPIYQAFWKSVLDYLEGHSNRVSEIPTSSGLLDLKEAAEELHATITSITNLCIRDVGMPSGGFLLTYLFNACLSARQNQLQQVLLNFLYDCTSVYVSKMIEPWLFEGSLNDSYGAVFFVQMNANTMHCRDRTYYQGITIYEEVVPCFLNNVAERILNCGRAVHLLELFDPENKFTALLHSKKYPKIRICWSEDELNLFKKEFDSYEAGINELCKESLTFQSKRQKYNEEDEKKKKKKLTFLLKSPITKIDSVLELRRKKQEEQYQMLKQQIQEQMEQRKLAKEEEAKQEQRRIEENALIQAKEDEIIEKEKLRIQQYYMDGLKKLDILEERNKWQNERLKLNDKRAQFLADDLLNKNNILDTEGNIIIEPNIIEDKTNCETEDSEGNIIIESNIIEDRTNCQTAINDTEPRKHCFDNDIPEEADEQGNIIDNRNKNADEMPADDNQNFQTPDDMIIENLPPNPFYNCGALAKANKAEAEKNRTKVLSGEYSLAEDSTLKTNDVNKSNVIMTDAMRNKLKILGAEFDTSDKISNELKHVKPTENEATKIKNLILSLEYGSSLSDDKHMEGSAEMKTDNQSDKQNHVISEAMKNKMKVLGSEFDIISIDSPESIQAEDVKLTDAMKNKLKVLKSEFDVDVRETDKFKCSNVPPSDLEKNKSQIECISEINGNIMPTKADVNLTAAQINKKKIMGTELGDYDYEKRDATLPEEPEAEDEHKTETAEEVTAVPSEDVKRTVNVFKPLIPEHSDSSVLFPTLPNLFPKNDKTQDLSKLNPDQFLRLLLKSMDIVIGAQERLANGAVLKHLLVDEKYASHVFSLRCYFLLHDGEFSRTLTHGLFESLAKCMQPQEFFQRNSLSNILDEALNDTIHDSENASLLSFQILEMPSVLDHEAHNVLFPFQLSYKVHWPLNIILTHEMLTRYRKIFHVLVSLKRVHWTLNETFHYLKSQAKDKKVDGKRLMNSPHYIKLAVYRHAMTLFIMTLEEHMSANGLREAYAEFEHALESATTFDQLYQVHVRYVKNVLLSCFLVNHSQDLLSYINELISLGLKFHYTIQSSAWHLVNDQQYEHPKYFVLKTIFNKFCETTSIFHKILRRKVRQPDMKVHAPLLLLIDMKIKV